MDYNSIKKHYIGLDIIRIVSALVICMFHTTIHLECDYGILNGFSKMGAIFMTMFFLLSGFSLFVNWAGEDLNDYFQIKKFLKRRFLGIVPMYYVACVIFEVFALWTGKESLWQVVILSPVETLVIQSFFSSLFDFTHNGGTWFISCLLICYLLYPYFQELIKKRRKKIR